MKRSWRIEPGSPFAHDDRNSRDSLGSPDQLEERAVGYFFGFGILYIVLMITLGVLTIRKGHWVMFVIGLFIPLLWLIGAIMPPAVPRR
jgi:hypothetical protein